MRIPNQITFGGSGAVFTADGGSVEKKKISGVGAPLPEGMFAKYTVTVQPSGKTSVSGVMQARAIGGRRYFSDSDESAAQARLLKWATRILRERTKEAA